MFSPLSTISHPEAIIAESATFLPKAFFKDFSEAIHLQINVDEKLNKVSSHYFAGMHQLIDDLQQKGYAELEGTDGNCRSVCVSIQGAIEEQIAFYLKSGELTAAKAIFLTPLPCTPLRKKGETQGLSSEEFDPSRQYTLDKREETVRKMMERGCQVFTAYSKEDYTKFTQESDLKADNKNQMAIYAEVQERFHDTLKDIQLDRSIPEELVGAFYLLTDKAGNKYYLATQGIQAQNAKPTCWKKWFGCEGQLTDAQKRATEMLNFIQKTNGITIDF